MPRARGQSSQQEHTLIKHVMRSAAVAVGAVLTVSALATPAAAENAVPEGCVGSVYYACTGDATPPYPQGQGWLIPETVVEVPVRFEVPSVQLVPGMTVGGQQIGGVIVPVGGELTPETSVTVGGPAGPFDTGIATPVNVCAFVLCLVAGDPVVVPGFSLPVVPVVVPALASPVDSVAIPVVGTVPAQTTPPVVTPEAQVEVTTVRLYLNRYDIYLLAVGVCEAGGGSVSHESEVVDNRIVARGRCTGGLTEDAANALFAHAKW